LCKFFGDKAGRSGVNGTALFFQVNSDNDILSTFRAGKQVMAYRGFKLHVEIWTIGPVIIGNRPAVLHTGSAGTPDIRFPETIT